MKRAIGLLALWLCISTASSAAPPEPGSARRAARSPDDPTLVSIQHSGSLKPPASMRRLALSPTGEEAFIAGMSGSVLLRVSTADGRELQRTALAAPVSSVSVSPSGDILAVTSEPTGAVSLLRTADLSRVGEFAAPPGVAKACFSRDGQSLFVAAGGQLASHSTSGAFESLSKPCSSSPSAIIALAANRFAVADYVGTSVTLFDGTTLESVGDIPCPPGITDLQALRQTADRELIIASAALAGVVIIADTSTREVLGTLDRSDPTQLGVSQGLSPYVVVTQGIRQAHLVDCDPFSATYGRSHSSAFMRSGYSAIGVAENGPIVAQSVTGSELSRFGARPLLAAPQTSSLAPNRGIPGSWASLSGSYGSTSAITAAFLQGDDMNPSPVVPVSPDRVDLEVPLQANEGASVVWTSSTSLTQVVAGYFIATSPQQFTVIGTIEAIDDLLTELGNQLNEKGLSAQDKQKLSQAIDLLKQARSLLRESGAYAQALDALAASFEAIFSSSFSASQVFARNIVHIVQFATYQKLEAAQSTLTLKDPDVAVATAAFNEARGLLAAGDLRGSVVAYLRSYHAVEASTRRARRLNGAQVARILTPAISRLHMVRDEIVHRKIENHHAGAGNSSLDQVLQLLARKGGDIQGTAVGALAGIRVPDAVARMRSALGLMAKQRDLEDLQEAVYRTLSNLVLQTVDAVESNVGPYDSLVVKARKCLLEAEKSISSRKFLDAVGCLEQALGKSAGTSTTSLMASSASLQLFESTGTDTSSCIPKIEIDKVIPVCLHEPSGIDPGKINPDPTIIKGFVSTQPTGLFGYVFVTIRREHGAVVRHFAAQGVVTPSPFQEEWDGKDDAGKIITLKGKPNEERFVVDVEFICYSGNEEPHSTPEQRTFKVVRDDGLIVTPDSVTLCSPTMDDPESSDDDVTVQFKAEKCKDGAKTDVTKEALWTIDNSDLGEIGAHTGLFKANPNVSGKGTVTAVIPGTPFRGTAIIHIVPEEGDIVPKTATLCINDTQDFDVFKGCNPDHEAVQDNDADYNWTVDIPALGDINAGGIFTAKQMGLATITATHKTTGKTYTATVDISDIDDIAVVTAPTTACTLDDTAGPFVVQVFCNDMPKEGVTVRFTSIEESVSGGGGPVIVGSASDDTLADGTARTPILILCGALSAGPGTSRLNAEARGLTAQAAMTVTGPEISVTANRDTTKAGLSPKFDFKIVPCSGPNDKLLMMDTSRDQVKIIENATTFSVDADTVLREDAGIPILMGGAYFCRADLEAAKSKLTQQMNDRKAVKEGIRGLWREIFGFEASIVAAKAELFTEQDRLRANLRTSLAAPVATEAAAYQDMNDRTDAKRTTAYQNAKNSQAQIRSLYVTMAQALVAKEAEIRQRVDGLETQIRQKEQAILVELGKLAAADNAMDLTLRSGVRFSKDRVQVVLLRRPDADTMVSPETGAVTSQITLIGYFDPLPISANFGPLTTSSGITITNSFRATVNVTFQPGAGPGDRDVKTQVADTELVAAAGFTVFFLGVNVPAGDPTGAPRDYANEFWYNFESPGALLIPCEAGTAPDTPRTRYFIEANHFRWSLGTLGESQITWESAWPGQATEGEGLYPLMVATGLPLKNTQFGRRELELRCIIGGTVAAQRTNPIEIFYSRDAQNNPGPTQKLDGPPPPVRELRE